ncbi:MAG: tetratricopeptide repeat protein [Spirulinaceae cyanobacterium]
MTLSKPPSTPPIRPELNPEAQQFLGSNAQVFAELLTFLDFAEKFTFGLVEINFPPDVQTLLDALAQHPSCAEMQFVVVEVGDKPELRFLRDEITAQLAQVEREPDKKLVLVVRGLARAIGTELAGDYPPVLQDLNFVRDAYKLHVPHPFLLVLPDYAVVRLMRFAPDFWAWHSGVFTFKTPETTRQAAHSQAIETYQHPVSRTIPEPQERIDLLERLLMEYQPSAGQAPTQLDLNTCSTILYELGVAYYSRRQFKKSRDYLTQTLELAKQKEDVSLKTKAYTKLGEVHTDEREFESATTAFNQALELARSGSNRRQEATNLFYLGTVNLETRRFTESAGFYQQCLQIEQEIDDRYSQAVTYHQLGRVAEALRDWEQARSHYQQALDIFIEFNDRYSQASTYFHLGKVHEATDDLPEARNCFLQDLIITAEFNDEHGLGISFRNLARFHKEHPDDEFLAAVAEALGMTVEQVRERFGQMGEG